MDVFQPPFQSGRTSPEMPQCRGDLPRGDVSTGSSHSPGAEDEAVFGSRTGGAANSEQESHLATADTQAASAQLSALHSGGAAFSHTSLSSTQTTDSGFSESISSTSCCSLDPHAEKETSCEKAVRPEGDTDAPVDSFARASPHSSLLLPAAVTGYQQPNDAAAGHASQFYIALLDSNNKEQRLDEKGGVSVETCQKDQDCISLQSIKSPFLKLWS